MDEAAAPPPNDTGSSYREKLPLAIPWVESPLFELELAARTNVLSPEQRTMVENFHTQGFVAVPGAVPEELCDRVRREVEPMFTDSNAVAQRRVQDAWRSGATAVRELAIFPPIQKLLSVLYDRRPVPFQTLDFKWGTEQRGHADAIHFSCLPARFMCGVWVALEDVDESNGPLFYYPGSQRLPEYSGYDLGFNVDEHFYPGYEDFQHDLMSALDIAPVEFHAAKGDALIWSSNVIHGGRPVLREGSTRWSQVSHYFFDGCIYYQPHASEIPTGELALLEVTNLDTMEPASPTYNGRPVFVQELPNGRSRVSFEKVAAPQGGLPAPSPSLRRRAAGAYRRLIGGGSRQR